jgi:O-antigen/teichoic acid export membrane protein
MEDFGILSLLLTLSAFLIYIFSLGSFQHVFRAATRNIEDHRSAFWPAVLLTLATSLLLTGCTFLWSQEIAGLFNLEAYQREMQLTMLGTASTSVMIVFLYHHYGLGRNNFQNFLQFLRGSLWVIVAIVLSLFFHLSLIDIFVVFNLSMVAIVLLALPWKEWSMLRPIEIKKASLLKLLRYCIPLLPYFAGAWGIPLIVRTQLNIHDGAREVAIFSVAYTLMEIVFMFISTITATISPYFFGQSDSDRPGLFYNIMLKYSILCILLVVPFIFVLRYDIILLVASEKYLMSGDYIPILIFFPLLRILIIVFEQYCLKMSQTFYLGVVYSISIILSLILSAILIPQYSVLGAIYTSIGSYLVILILLYIKQRTIIDFQYLDIPTLAKLTLVLGGVSALVFFSGMHIIYKIMLLGSAAILGLFLLPVFNEQERNKIVGLFK